MTSTIEEVDFSLIEHLDEDIACQYAMHGMFGQESLPASWAVWMKKEMSCGCNKGIEFRFFCDPCWAFRSNAIPVTCPDCFKTMDPIKDVIKVVRIRD